MSAILYIALFAYHLVLPGWLGARLLGLRRGRWPFSIAGSYSLVVLNLVALEWVRAPAWVFAAAFSVETAALAAAEWSRCRRARPGGGHGPAAGFRPLARRAWPPLLIALGVLLYLAWAGAYMELPADPCKHLGRVWTAWAPLAEEGRLMPLALPGTQTGYDRQSDLLVPGLLSLLTRQGSHWYVLQALLCRWSGLAVGELPGPLTLANMLVFCWTVYAFTLWLWAGRRWPRGRVVAVALTTVLLTALWLGISLFAFIRYYALAPAMINYGIFLAVMMLSLDYLAERRWRRPAVWLAPLWVWTLLVTHTQEAAFAFFMGMGALLVLETRLPTRRRPGSAAPAGRRVNWSKVHVFAAAAVAAYVLLALEALGKPVAEFAPGLFTPLMDAAPRAGPWYILSPHGQFYQVLTGWGVFVGVLFLVHARDFESSPFLLAGMLMPVLTVFNPLSLTLLARWAPDVQALYRFSYLLPLPLVAGWLAVRFWSELVAPRAVGSPGVGRRMRSAVCLLGLAGLLLPWEPLFGWRSNSRLFTLRPIPPANDLRHWGDLIAELQARPGARIVSDPYTRVLLRTMNIRVASWKVFRRLANTPNARQAMLRELDPNRETLLAVNRRVGAFSANGARSGHWTGDVLQQFPGFYPESLLESIRRNPRHYRRLWARDGIVLYEIVRPP